MCDKKGVLGASRVLSTQRMEKKYTTEHSKLWDLRSEVRERRLKWTSDDQQQQQFSLSSDTIREDYCKIYCGGSCANESCSITDNVVATEGYKMNLVFSVLEISWINPEFDQWKIYNIFNHADCEIVKTRVVGIISAEDERLRPRNYYLRLLGLKAIVSFEIQLPSLIIFEETTSTVIGPEMIIFKYLISSPVNSYVTNNYIRETMNNKKTIKIYHQNLFEKPLLTLKENVFEGKTKLSTLVFSNLMVNGLTEKTFDNLENITLLIFNNVVLSSDFTFLRSSALRKSLKHCIMYIDKVVDLKNFDNFPNLEYIEVNHYKRFPNLTAFICSSGENACQFTLGVNGISCPPQCNCLFHRNTLILEINCWQQNLKTVPPIPVPIAGISVLFFQQNQLTELPNHSLLGYKDLKCLNVSQNQLSSLTINRLPEALEHLDISYNQIFTLSPEVVEYLKGVSTFNQFGNKWFIYCDEVYLQEFFWQKAKTLRIQPSKFDAVFEYLDVTANAMFLSYSFVSRLNGLYMEADEDEILASNEYYFMLKIMEEFHIAVWVFYAEYDEVIVHHLNSRCPYRCSCCVERDSGQFIINCANSSLDFYPKLPNSIPYNTTLILEDNEIRKLTIAEFVAVSGLASIQKLLMRNNMLIEFPNYLIPENITFLDLRNNGLKSLSDNAVAFLRYREELTEVKLSGNPWESNCKAKSFLSFLREHEPTDYDIIFRRVNITQEECPEFCICCVDTSDYDLPSLTIDCSGKGLREIPPLPTPTIGRITLVFERNKLKKWPNNSLPGYTDVGRLHLAHNQLSLIDELPENIEYLDISYNKFTVLSDRVRTSLEKKMNSSHMKLFLSGNPWTCSCEERDFLEFVKEHAKNIGNTTTVQCGGSGKSLIEIEEIDICPSAIVYYASLGASLLIVALSINVFICFKQPILIWFYEHEVCLSLATRRELDQDKKYDAFLSFTHKDEELIGEFVERLEKGRHKFRLCFYLRDWLVGESIPECISQSVKDSKRIIILMTNNFMKSTWGRLEFRLALHATSKDRCKRLIVVLYPDVENFDDLDSELKAYMVLNTYLDRNNPNFWNKLIYSMPHVILQRNITDLETKV
ncbi:toll-like receptor 5 [Drosophila ficusphila]|uniref:toll-like receptor 5 n=1 Tax=Drosophila ficusphila TaxID=30025 RepID=UPI001C89F470|nr:toll-like receptor 5 [Drosophila ficusphila]